MDFTLSKTQKLMIDSIREFTQREVTPRADEMEESGALPDDLIHKMARLGLLGMKDASEKNWIMEAAAAKIFVVPAAMEVVNKARMLDGAYGYTQQCKIERLYRVIAGASAIAVSLEINKSMVGGQLLKGS